MMRRIGILGGMGPEATILIMQKLLACVQASDDSDHIPLIVDQNTQVPSRIRYLLDGHGADPAPVLADMARRLVAAGAQALAMPCNTAHHFADAIRAAVDVPLIDMVGASAARAAELANCGKLIGILASPALRKVALFDAPLAKHDLTAIYPSDEAAMLAAIRQIKTDGPTPAARQTLLAASVEMLQKGAAVQMVACTEFSLIADAVAENITSFDTLDLLVADIKEFALKSGAK